MSVRERESVCLCECASVRLSLAVCLAECVFVWVSIDWMRARAGDAAECASGEHVFECAAGRVCECAFMLSLC